MEHSMAYPAVDVPAWKSAASTVAAVLLAVLWLASGLWKITDPIGWSGRLIQLQFPPAFATAGTLLVGSSEVFAGVLILVPRFRRWGAWLSALLLVAFMIYIGANYGKLIGEECSCFPWIKRAVGPMFFVEDGALIGLAAIAGLWAGPSFSRRSAVLVAAAIAVFAGASYGATTMEQKGVMAPVSVTVDGKPLVLQQGKFVVYFFDPQCMHCFHAAQHLQSYHWKDVKIVGVPWTGAFMGPQFLKDTGLQALLVTKAKDIDLLKEKLMSSGYPPYAVLIEDGKQKTTINTFDDPEPYKTLHAAGWVE